MPRLPPVTMICRSAILELRLSLMRERFHAFDGIGGLEGDCREIGFDTQAVSERRVTPA